MKKIFGILMLLAVVAVGIFCGTTIPALGVILAAPPVVLDTQQIVFLRSLKEEYEAIDTWMSEADDLSMFVEDGQTLVFPESGADPAVYKNRVTDIDDVEPEETVHKVALDVYDSQNYKLRNIYLHALPFEKVQHYTKKSANAIVKQEVLDTAYAFSPDSEGNKKIVIPTTGPARSDYKMMTLTDMETLARACDNARFPEARRNLVLPSDMWWDLVTNNPILKGQLERAPLTGIILPLVVEYYGFKIHKSGMDLNVGWDLDNEVKAAQGTVITGDIVPSGFLFLGSEVFRASGRFEMFKKVKSQNTTGRAEEFGFQHRFKTDFQMSAQRYSGLIYMAKSA
ncbi:MAG: hypothetical protein FWG22_03835 [Prolixibacteraceae bacterium]|nr:hypothetical protein [Prolixibacteraceae bacterium]